jgi:hypothetical protein
MVDGGWRRGDRELIDPLEDGDDERGEERLHGVAPAVGQ